MVELWKDIIDYEGLYQISNLGNVKSLERTYRSGKKYTTIKHCKELILTPRLTKTGYCRVGFKRNGKVKDFYIHRLVAVHFIENTTDYTEINHIDENKSNNKVYNLEWCSRKYNCNHGNRNDKVSVKNKEYFLRRSSQ